MTVKTTLVAGAPWPKYGEEAKAEAAKKKDALVTGSKLGLSIKEEIKQKTKKAGIKKPNLEPREFHIYQKARPSK